ncbi:MAG TPA: thioredoxin family protein [Coleofasciculaceae cyanobacterium]
MNENLWQRRQLLLLGLGIVGAGAAVALPRLQQNAPPLTAPNSGKQIPDLAAAMPPAGETLPEFQGISAWLNSAPLTLSELKGNVVLVQFWTFACINCQRTLPYVTRWHQQYAAQGLKVIGVHTPEFAFEREESNIKNALRQHQITYPVPIDNDYKTWSAYKNNYWPHLYLADRQGILQYDHIGEGAYDKTEQVIRQLLG